MRALARGSNGGPRAAPDGVASSREIARLRTRNWLAGSGAGQWTGTLGWPVTGGWLGPNHPAFLESLFAAGLLGAALAPVNHRLDHGEINGPCEDTEPSLLIQHLATGTTVPFGSCKDRRRGLVDGRRTSRRSSPLLQDDAVDGDGQAG